MAHATTKTFIADIRGLEGRSVASALIGGDDHLRLLLTDGSTVDAGDARGPQGLAGTDSAPADEAVASYIGTTGTSATKAALLNAVVPQDVLSSLVYVGVSDFTTDTQAKIDAAAFGGGGVIDITKGESELLTGTLLLKQGVTIRGRGKNATELNLSGNFPAFASATPLSRIDNVGLSDLRIYRIVPAAANTPVIDWTGISHSNIHDVSIEQPSSSRFTTEGIRFGAASYYNHISMVQVRAVNVGMMLANEANGNNITHCLAINSDYGYIADGTNSVLFLGSAAEIVDAAGFVIRDGSKKNRIIGCRVEDSPLCYQVVGGATPAFDNFLIANLAYERSGGVRYDIQTANVVIEESTARYLNYLAHSQVEAHKQFGQTLATADTWTKVLFELEDVDQLGEYATSTFTAAAAGLYQVSAAARWTTAAVGTHLELAVYKNGAIAAKLADVWAANTSNHVSPGSLSMKLAAGDKIEIWARESATATMGLQASTTESYFRVTRIA